MSNLHIAKYMHFQCTVWWIVTNVYIQVTIIIIVIKIRDIFVTLKRALVFLCSHSPHLEFCINGILQYICLCVRLVLLSIMFSVMSLLLVVPFLYLLDSRNNWIVSSTHLLKLSWFLFWVLRNKAACIITHV